MTTVGTDAPAANGPNMVRLVDGSEVSSWSEAYRHECEARWLLSLPFEQRQAIILGTWTDVFTPGKPKTQVRRHGIEQKRGRAVVDALRVTMLAIIAERRQQLKAA